MAIVTRKSTQKSNKFSLRLWFERIMAILALANLILVIFDLTYIPLRDFWLQGKVQIFVKLGKFEESFPQHPVKILPFNITPYYDWVKGIEAERTTTKYLNTVDKLNQTISEGAWSTDITRQQEQEIEEILEDLREQSIDLINDSSPFIIANKIGQWERIKNKMRVHVFDTKDISAKEAFKIFWSQENLQKDSQNQIAFFELEIRPLIAANYFRPVGETGDYVDNFGLLDFPFFVIFGIEFLTRTWYISRRYTSISWLDAMLWRWYDIFLLIPLFRWLRVIPVTIRLNQADLIDLGAIKKQVSQGFVASIAEDVTEVVVIQVINQIQGTIRRGEIGDLLKRQNGKEYIDLNEINEIAEITKLLMDMMINQVLPEIRPDLEKILEHTLDKAINQSSAYQGLQKVPGMKMLTTNLTEQISQQFFQVLSNNLQVIWEDDPIFAKLLQELIQTISTTISTEMQAKQSIERLEFLVAELLEEVKVNYVQNLSEQDVEELLEQTRKLRQKGTYSPPVETIN